MSRQTLRVRDGLALAICCGVAQRSIEILIGRLITDEAFRSAFRRSATKTLRGFVESGYELTPLEMTAVCTTPVDVWEEVATRIDARLQKTSLETRREHP